MKGLVLLVCLGLAAAAAYGEDYQQFFFDHFKSGESTIFNVSIVPGNYFKVQITSQGGELISVEAQGAITSMEQKPNKSSMMNQALDEIAERKPSLSKELNRLKENWSTSAARSRVLQMISEFKSDSDQKLIPVIANMDSLQARLIRSGYYERQDTVLILTIPHEDQYGGYFIKVKSKNGKEIRTFKPEKNINFEETAKYENPKFIEVEKELYLIDSVETQKQPLKLGEVTVLREMTLAAVIQKPVTWECELAGGFVGTLLTNPIYFADQNSIIQEDHGKQDKIRPDFAGFVHVVPPWRWVHRYGAMSCGIGMNQKNLELFPGVSIRFAGKAYLTAGYHIGSVARLPSNLQVGSNISGNLNALSKMDTRSSGNFFFGLSYSFMNPGESFFTKPFAQAKSDKKEESQAEEKDTTK